MKLYESAAIGVVLGAVYGVILWASIDAFTLASWILYGNGYRLPFMTTAIATSLLLAGVFSYKMWENRAENAIVWLADWLEQQRAEHADELEDERNKDWLLEGSEHK